VKRTIVLMALMLTLAGCGGEIEDRGSSSEPKSGTTGSESTAPETTKAEPQAGKSSELRPLTIGASGGEEVKVRVEVADDPDEQAQGLMNRKKLGEKRGMLFVYTEEKELSFWMRNTLIPLSIAYIDAEGRIVDIQDMKPLDDVPPSYVSAEPAQYALEVNKGFFDERGVEVGDRVELPE